MDKPTPLEPLAIECAVCGGVGCDDCSGGQKLYTSCPKDVLTQEVVRVGNLSDFFDSGVLPEAGGLNDQDAKFVSYMSALKNNEAYFQKGD